MVRLQPDMRCRFCDTDIADKALVCYRCGRATTDAKVAPPPRARGLSLPVALGVVSAATGAAIGLPGVADGTVLYGGWAALSVVAAGALTLWWGGRVSRR